MLIKRFEKNVVGNDYIVGDIHGCYTKLYQKLSELQFNREKDRLFCTGDLVDRGEESIDCLDILAEPWFHSVRGNHDQMAVAWVLRDEDFFAMSPSLYTRNGGQWFMDLDKETQLIVASELDKLPIMIEVDTDLGMVGILHADCPMSSWDATKTEILNNNRNVILNCMWNRDKIYNNDKRVILGIDKIYHGHTVLQVDSKLGNRHYIDTGAVFPNGYFTILKL